MPQDQGRDDSRLVEEARVIQVQIWRFALEHVSDGVRHLLYSYQALGVLDRLLTGFDAGTEVVSTSEVRAGICRHIEEALTIMRA